MRELLSPVVAPEEEPKKTASNDTCVAELRELTTRDNE